MKNFGLAFYLILGLAGAAFAQEEGNQVPQTQSRIYLWMEGNTGTLVNNTVGPYSGNELILGLRFTQNIAKAPWLSWTIAASAVGKATFNYINLNGSKPDAVTKPDWFENGATGFPVSFNYIELGLNFSKYAYIRFRNAFETHIYLFYPLELPRSQRLTFMTGVEVTPLFRGARKNTIDPSYNTPGRQTEPYLQLFTFGVDYYAAFAKGWGFNTSLYFRTSGALAISAQIQAGEPAWETDTAAAFVGNMHMRWDNTISWTSSKGIRISGLIRYEPTRIKPNAKNFGIIQGQVLHDVYLKFLFEYSYNFGKTAQS